MIKKTIAFTDYNGNERKQDFYFNLSKAEIMELEYNTEGGLQAMLEKMVNEQDVKHIMEMFKKIVMLAYGEKAPDGVRFIKSKELSEAFTQTEAYSELMMELLNDADKVTEFMLGVLPKLPEGTKLPEGYKIPGVTTMPEAAN